MRLGTHPSPEARAKMSAAWIGRVVSLETRAKMSALHKGQKAWNKGISPSDETRAKISAAGMGRIPSPETRAKQALAEKGKTVSPETCARLSAALIGKPAWNKGVSPSDETRVKIGIGHWKGGPRVSMRKRRSKRRLLGFNPLNSWFMDCEAHHINQNDVIHIPRKLHRSIYHDQYTGRGMAQMNALAGQYLMENWT